MIRSTIMFCVLALGLGLFQTTSAQAVLVTTTISGSVDFADPSNPFGLSAGDSVSAVAVYDDSGIPPAGAFNLELDSDTDFSLTITLGSFTFEETDDDGFGSGFPRLEYEDGDLVGLEFLREGFGFGSFANLDVGAFNNATQWFLDDFASDTELLEGTWNFANAVTVPNVVTAPPTSVPEPAAWLLFAGGLAGLAGMTRQTRKARPGV